MNRKREKMQDCKKESLVLNKSKKIIQHGRDRVDYNDSIPSYLSRHVGGIQFDISGGKLFMKKRRIALLLSLSMAAALFGCGNSAGQEAAGTESVQSKAVEENVKADGTAEKADPAFDPFEETVTLTSAMSVKTNVTYPEGDSDSDNIWTRAIREDLNIDLVLDWVSEEYTTKLNLAISTGDIPDVFTVNEEQFSQLIEADLIWDLNEVFDEYASDALKGLRESNEDVFSAAMRDGALYGIPELHYGYVSNPSVLWIRNDWKEELGLEDPETMDDVVEICLAFMEKCGASYGISVEQSLGYLYDLAPAWQAYPEIWIRDENGKVVYGSVQEEMKEALSAWHEWYEQGIIDADFATTDSTKVTQDAVTGQVGVQVYENWWGWSVGTDVVNNLGADAVFYAYEIPSATGEEVLATVTMPNMSYTVVSKKCKNPEAVIKVLNYYRQILVEARFDGSMSAEERRLYVEEGGLEHALPFRILNTDGDYDSHIAITEAIESGTAMETTSPYYDNYNDCITWLNEQDSSKLGLYLQRGDAQRSAYGVVSKLLESDRLLRDCLWGETPQSLLDYGSTLDDLLLEGFTKIIMGEESVDYFDTLVENWRQAGGDTVTAAMNELYGE